MESTPQHMEVVAHSKYLWTVSPTYLQVPPATAASVATAAARSRGTVAAAQAPAASATHEIQGPTKQKSMPGVNATQVSAPTQARLLA